MVRVADFIDAFGEDPGDLPDGVVLNSSHADWQPLLDALHAARWPMVLNGAESLPVPREVPTLLATDEFRTFFVYPVSAVGMNFLCTREGPVRFDIDLREIVTQEALNGLCEAIRLIGLSTEKDVVVTHEGFSRAPVLTFDASTDRFALHR
jgi:hypothetical protein